MPGSPWTPSEKKTLRRQVQKEGRALVDVAIDGRTINAIRSQAVRMRLVEKRASRQKWPAKQRRRLRELKEEGFTPREICEFDLLGDPPRTKWSITKQWGRMKLANRRRARLMRKKKIWEPGDRERFRKYLRKYSKTQTPEEIGRAWGVARSTVARWQNELGIKASREQVMRMGYSLVKQNRARKKIRQNSKQMWVRRRADREQALYDLAEEIRTSARPAAEQVCSDCEQSWPKRREFFHIREKKISMGTSRYYKHRCVLCENRRRRAKVRRRKRSRSHSP